MSASYEDSWRSTFAVQNGFTTRLNIAHKQQQPEHRVNTKSQSMLETLVSIYSLLCVTYIYIFNLHLKTKDNHQEHDPKALIPQSVQTLIVLP